MANSTRGSYISAKAYEKYWERFDALPVRVKAAFWDALANFDHDDTAKAIARGCPERQEVETIEAWDRKRLNQRQKWMVKRKPGTATADLPLTPHQAAKATLLRSYRHLTHPPAYKRLP